MSLFGRLKKLKCNPLKKKGYRLEYHPVPPEADTMAMSRARFFMALVASTTINHQGLDQEGGKNLLVYRDAGEYGQGFTAPPALDTCQSRDSIGCISYSNVIKE
jgi:hypothetical protein